MSILPQQKFLTRSSTRLPTNLHHCSRTTCSTTTTASSKPKPTHLSIKPKLQNPTITTTHDPSLQSTWSHRAWVAAGCTSVFVALAKAVAAGANSHAWVQPMLAGYIGYIIADLGSGVYHWGTDNYGDASAPVFGTQIEAFQGHHKWPWRITRQQFANNLHALARAAALVLLPTDLLCNDAVILSLVGLCAGCVMFSQQFHAWAHCTKSKLPPLVVALQDFGLLVPRPQHAAHHRPPYNNNYCIESGVWNEFLDRNKVFEAMEMVLYFRFREKPRSWSDLNSHWTEETESSSPAVISH